MKNSKIGEKKVKEIIYDKMLEDLFILRKKRSEETDLQLSEITRKYLQGKIQKAVKIYNLFEKVGMNKIKYITTYTANAILELTNDKLQEIIDNFSKQNLYLNGNSSDDSSKIGLVAVSISSVSQVISFKKSRLSISILSDNPEEKRKYIIRLVLERFPSLYLSVSSERDERFNLNSSTLCPLCNEDHKEESLWNDIKGKWDAGDYYGELTYHIKCKDSLNCEPPIISVKA